MAMGGIIKGSGVGVDFCQMETRHAGVTQWLSRAEGLCDQCRTWSVLCDAEQSSVVCVCVRASVWEN